MSDALFEESCWASQMGESELVGKAYPEARCPDFQNYLMAALAAMAGALWHG